MILTLREEHNLQMLQNKMLRSKSVKMFRGEGFTMRNLIACFVRLISVRMIDYGIYIFKK